MNERVLDIEGDLFEELVDAVNYIITDEVLKSFGAKDAEDFYAKYFRDYILAYIEGIESGAIKVCSNEYCYNLSMLFYKVKRDFKILNFVLYRVKAACEVVDKYYEHECAFVEEIPKVMLIWNPDGEGSSINIKYNEKVEEDEGELPDLDDIDFSMLDEGGKK